MRKIERTKFAWPNRIMNIAHRGARSEAPENTMLAARTALNQSADMWELDVQMTFDGVPVVMHDDTLERTSNIDDFPEYKDRKPEAHRFTLEELRRMDFGSWYIETDPFGMIAGGVVTGGELRGLPIPTLEEALLFTRDNGWLVNVEIKDLEGLPGHVRIVEAVTGMISGLNMEDRVLLSSFQHDYLGRAKEILPNLATAVLIEKEEDAPDPLALLERYGAEAYHPYAFAVSPEQIRELRGKGYLVNLWTVNAEQDMRHFIDLGVDGLITDYPKALGNLLP